MRQLPLLFVITLYGLSRSGFSLAQAVKFSQNRIQPGLQVAAPTQAAGAITYDASQAFAASDNKSGAWSYGWMAAGERPNAATFKAFERRFGGNMGMTGWMMNGVDVPVVQMNQGPDVARFGTTIEWQPKQMSLHPGLQGEYCVIRWTAPEAGRFDVEASFLGLDTGGPTTTDVHILVNGASIFDGVIDGAGPSSRRAHTGTVTVKAGNTVDFVVGWGSNHTGFGDTTGFSAIIKPHMAGEVVTPAPETPKAELFRHTGTLETQIGLPALTGTRGWTLLKVGAARAEMASEDGALRVRVNSADGVYWHAQLAVAGLDMTRGKMFTLRFRAKAEEHRDISVKARLDVQNPTNDSPLRTYQLDEQWRDYTMVFANKGDVGRIGTLLFSLGQQEGAVWFRDMSLTAGASDLDKKMASVMPTPSEDLTLQVPWHTDMLQARAEAERFHKPLFIWSMTGNPMGAT